MKIKQYLKTEKDFVEAALETYMLKADGPFAQHIEAMRYSLFAGGKRVRPILCLAAGRAVSSDPEIATNLLPVACALECIHTYSLIHDDLPAMDDDDLRRGKPTSHMLYGEAAAILAGDGLLSWAFDLLTDPQHGTLAPEIKLRMTHVIARAAGSLGMVGGQALDIASENQDFPFSTLQTIHKSKTGALITCAVEAGALGGGATEQQLTQLVTYGHKIGLAFQIVDDLLNVTATTQQLGKAAGSDAERGKATYPAYLASKRREKRPRQWLKRP